MGKTLVDKHVMTFTLLTIITVYTFWDNYIVHTFWYLQGSRRDIYMVSVVWPIIRPIICTAITPPNPRFYKFLLLMWPDGGALPPWLLSSRLLTHHEETCVGSILSKRFLQKWTTQMLSGTLQSQCSIGTGTSSGQGGEATSRKRNREGTGKWKRTALACERCRKM